MFSAASLLIGTLLASSITGSPVEVHNSPITLPMTRRLKSSNGTNPMQRDDADIYLDSIQTRYCISVGVGIPPTHYDLIVDTGTAITWIGADINNPYRPTDTSYNTELPIQRTYGYGYSFFSGTLFTDTLSFENGLNVSTMPIGVAFESEGIEYDGILGIGPKSLSRGILKNAPTKPLLTITDRLFFQGKISQHLVGLYFQPSSKNKDDSGVLTFGGVVTDPEFNVGKIAYVTTTARPPSSRYWGIDQSITYGNTEILGVSAGIVDCGATFITIASDAFEKYKAATGAHFDLRTKLLFISPEKYGALQPLNFHIGYQTYSLVPNAQIWPRHLNFRIGGVSDGIYLVLKREPTGIIAFSLGYVFLQRFYSVFDSTRSCVGFATTRWTDAITN
ncbi:acid protease [Suillus spraguei]|nr:acid protease [Suillus spraguei]